MKFGPVALAQAEGAVLAHALKLPDGRLKKGTVLSATDLERIANAGTETVIAARLDETDVGEDEAARRIAAALASDTIRAEAAATGRVNLYATLDGLFIADRVAVDALNMIDPGITLATLDHLREANAGRLVATVKIIPYAVSSASVERAVEISNSEVIGIDRYRPRRIGVVATQLPSLKPSVMDKTIGVLEGRLAASGSTIAQEVRTSHNTQAISDGIKAVLSESDIVLVYGASAICDIDDVIPSAIRQLGGSIVHFGMPVDPGNLLLIGELSGKPVIGAPGCARSPAENGFDWVLQRLIAGRTVTPAEISGMGVGGLLMEIGARPQPREGKKPDKRVTALVLAAGRSTRMGETNKLLAEFEGRPLVSNAVQAAVESAANETVVVTGHEAGRVESALAGQGARLVHNPDYADGLSTSLRTGIGAVGDDCDAALVLLGDMPLVTTPMIDRMIEAFVAAQEGTIVMAAHDGVRGNPVLWPRQDFAALQNITGDKGARDLLAENGDRISIVELGKAAGFDIDTPGDLEVALTGPGRDG